MSHPRPASPTKVIHTYGTPFEMGRQHAEAMGSVIHDGMVTFYYDFWKRMLDNPPKGYFQSRTYRLLTKLIDPGLVNKLLASVPEGIQERLKGIAASSGMSFEKIATPLVLPDLLPMLQAYAGKFRAVNLIDVSRPPLFGCSSFLSKGESFIQGRNLDFPGVSYWDRYPVIQVFKPNKGLSYIGFTTAGVPIAGISGINEAQISVALHQHYSLETNLNGQLPFVITEKILNEARTLDAALQILQSSKVASSWAFVVADGKFGEGFIVETHAKALGVRRLNAKQSLLTHSNYFQSPECAASEYATTERMNWDNFARAKQLEKSILLTQGKLSLEAAARMVSDHTDPYWNEEKIINRTVSQVYNIQSYVLDLTRMKVLLAEGDAPIHIRGYQEYDLGEIFAGKSGRVGKPIPGYEFRSEAKRKAKESYILSFIAAFDGDFEKALVYLHECMEADYCAEAGLVAGILLLKKAQYEEGIVQLAKAKDFIFKKKEKLRLSNFPPEYFEIWLYYARALDLVGKRAEALKEYAALVQEPSLRDQNLKRIARAAGPYKHKKLDKIIMPYSSYIPFA